MTDKTRAHARAVLADSVLRYEMGKALAGVGELPQSIADAILDAALKELTEPRTPAVGRF